MITRESIETRRLILRRPRHGDAEQIFSRYASDPEVTRLLGWPTHRSLDDTRAFIAASDALWSQWPAGPYLIFSRTDGTLLGTTGLAFEIPTRASTGYALARDAWGQGYATEALRAVVEVARASGVVRLYALCEPENAASIRVLEKCGFERESLIRKHSPLPNVDPDVPTDVLCYVTIFERAAV